MRPRYAIYYTPPRGSDLSVRAAAWLGRDAWSGGAVPRPDLPGLDGLDLDALTADPRRYGFHATLKAPFELAEGQEEAALLAAADRMAAGLATFSASITPASLGRFLGFELTGDTQAMARLHAACLSGFETFRAPISEFDIARRRKSGLTPEQDARLLQWGYPYVFDDFRFHMTLTGAIASDALHGRLLTALGDYFAADVGDHVFDAICVFKQPVRGEPFNVLGRFAFGGGHPPGRASSRALSAEGQATLAS
ncbi:DUF1045 domain-containing protein [Phenylobacterium sp. LjRoot225]|uniref:DUF1045 domain-containing protein n=1 Tax=Phenylobacterium sp. LjRoot225 TaxID=3342285 RepID=UPI003ECEAEAA